MKLYTFFKILMAVRVIEKNTTEQNPKCLESPVTYNLRPKTKTNCSR